MRYLLTLLGVIALLVQNVSAAERPNLVMIFTDDQRYDAVGYAGNDAVHTPNLDRLAQQGLIFRNCFVNTSICAVSRANLLSGQYPGRHGIDDFHKTFTPEQLRRTVPARLRDAGYQTAFFGKWGIGDVVEPVTVQELLLLYRTIFADPWQRGHGLRWAKRLPRCCWGIPVPLLQRIIC